MCAVAAARLGEPAAIRRLGLTRANALQAADQSAVGFWIKQLRQMERPASQQERAQSCHPLETGAEGLRETLWVGVMRRQGEGCRSALDSVPLIPLCLLSSTDVPLAGACPNASGSGRSHSVGRLSQGAHRAHVHERGTLSHTRRLTGSGSGSGSGSGVAPLTFKAFLLTQSEALKEWQATWPPQAGQCFRMPLDLVGYGD